jgi:hypothetical protein
MEKAKRFLTKYPIFIIIFLALPAMRALFVPGFYGASDDLHIAWLFEMDRVIREGQFPPRFVPDLSYQFGYPLFDFVFPLPFYVAEVFHLTGLSLVTSIKMLFALSLPLSGYFMYRLLKKFCSPVVALAGAVVYMYTPYRSTDIYVRGAVGEAFVFIFLPLAILATINLLNSRQKGRVSLGIFAISIAALITSHNIVAYMFLPLLFLLVLICIFFQKHSSRLKLFFKVLLGIFFGLLISSYFWIPAIVESRLMVESTVFNFIDHFPTLGQLVTPYFGWGASVAGPYDGMSFFIGLINLILVVLGIILIFRFRRRLTKEQLILSIWALIVFFLAVFMMNFRSTFVWNVFPYIAYFQFPWRYLSMVTLVTPLFVIPISKLGHSKYIGIAIIVFAILTNFLYFKPHDYFPDRNDDYYINKYIPEPHASDAYRQTGEEYLRLSKNTAQRPGGVYPRVSVKRGEFKEVVLINSLDARFTVQSEVLALVSYNKYLFPGWYAKVDGEYVSLHPGRPFGQIYINLLPGTHTVEVFYRETKERLILDAISLLSLVIAITMMISKPNENKN